MHLLCTCCFNHLSGFVSIKSYVQHLMDFRSPMFPFSLRDVEGRCRVVAAQGLWLCTASATDPNVRPEPSIFCCVTASAAATEQISTIVPQFTCGCGGFPDDGWTTLCSEATCQPTIFLERFTFQTTHSWSSHRNRIRDFVCVILRKTIRNQQCRPPPTKCGPFEPVGPPRGCPCPCEQPP